MRLNLPLLARLRRGFAVGPGFAPALVSGLLVVALLLSGVVPQGMMRVADAYGQRLVLCTLDGPHDIWMRPDGSLQDRAPAPGQNRDTGKCLPVVLALAAVQADLGDLHRRVDFARFRPVLRAAARIRPPLRLAPEPRAPPSGLRLS